MQIEPGQQWSLYMHFLSSQGSSDGSAPSPYKPLYPSWSDCFIFEIYYLESSVIWIEWWRSEKIKKNKNKDDHVNLYVSDLIAPNFRDPVLLTLQILIFASFSFSRMHLSLFLLSCNLIQIKIRMFVCYFIWYTSKYKKKKVKFLSSPTVEILLIVNFCKKLANYLRDTKEIIWLK